MHLSTSLALAALGLAASALPAAAGTLLVPSKAYPTIQSAVNAAKPGDTVQVSAKPNGGVYSESVTISTPHITLQGKGGPVIDGSKLGKLVIPPESFFQPYTFYPNGIDIRADHVAVCGMTVQNFLASIIDGAGTGISVTQTAAQTGYSDITVSGNTLKNDAAGLVIVGYTGNPYFYDGTGTYTKGFTVTGNTFTGNHNGGATIQGASVVVAGNTATGNGLAGLSVTGIGVTVSGNESGGNGGDGLDVTDAAFTYDPSINDPKYPNPAPTVVSLNSVHDNGGTGLAAGGTMTISGNLIAGNTSYGISLDYADFSAVTGNLVTGTVLGYGEGNGTGIYVGSSAYNDGSDSGLKVSLNQVSGNVGDGIYFYEAAGGVISFNSVTGNQGVGIHLSDYATLNAYYVDYGDLSSPTTVAHNLALHNSISDARDDATAPDYIFYSNEPFYGDDGAYGPTINVWTKNVFGTTDPKGLSK